MTTVFIISGPAGVGKNTLWNVVEPLCSEFTEKIITSTSRDPREGEVNGVDYHFISRDEFEKKIHLSEMIEYALVHTNYYGSTYSELARVIDTGKCPVYIIEPQGMIHMKPLLENQQHKVVSIFIVPPSLEELRRRLGKRGTETEEAFEIRMATALAELEQKDLYQYQIINDSIDSAKKALLDLILLEK